MPTVVYAPEADRDLVEIGIRIALDKPDAADRFVATIRELCETLAKQPLMGERFRSRSHIRRFSIGNYVVYYHPRSNGVDILRIWHGARGSDPKL